MTDTNTPTRTAKDVAQDALMHGLQAAISNMPAETATQRKEREQAIRQFRRIEKLFGYIPQSWSPFA